MGAKCCKTDKQEEERLRRALLLQQTSSTLLDRYASLSPHHPPSTRPQSSISTTQQEYSTRSPTPGIRRTQSTTIPQDYYHVGSQSEFNFRSSSNTIYPLNITDIRANQETLPRTFSRSPSAPPRKSRKFTGSSGFFEEFSTSSNTQQFSTSSNPPTQESLPFDVPPATPPRRRRKDSSASTASGSKRVSEVPHIPDLPQPQPPAPVPPVREVSITKRKIRSMTLIKGDNAPGFVRNLTDVAVKVGTRTRLLAEIEPNTRDQDEVMKVSWFRNDQKISFPTDGTSRIRQTSEGRFHYLDISPVLTDDEGKWICLAENFHGRTSSTCFVKVMVPKSYRPPEFVESLKAVLTEAGTVSLECKVIGTPTPLLKWYKDGVEIKAGDIFALRGDASSLGVYTCEATNCMGSVTSSSKVHMNEGTSPLPGSIQITSSLLDSRVRVGEKIEFQLQINKQFDDSLKVNWYNKSVLIPASDRVQQITNSTVCACTINPVEVQDDGEWTCEIVSATNEKVRVANSCVLSILVPRNYRKPKFLEDLKAILTEEGLVSFECKVCGFPTPILHWYKDGYELKPGDVYQLSGANSLGRYSCVAHNCMGDAESSTELTLEDIQHQLSDDERKQLIAEGIASKRPPKFVKGLKSIEVKIGDPCELQIQLNDAKSTVSWFKDSVCVDSEERYVLRNEGGGTHTLLIQELEFDDQAEWKCTGTNEYGHSVSTAGLKLIIPSTYKKPKFLESLRAVLSEEGTVNLECKVIGVPVPVLKWYKDGVELKAGDIHRIISGADGTCCLGTYTCVAKNCMGEVSSSAALLGFEDKLEKDAQQKQEAQRAAANLTRDPSLSTIMEERTSQMLSVYETPGSLVPRSIEEEDHARAGAGDISVSIDGKDVSVSLYETPDLTENDAKQIIEMFANEYSEYISEHNVVPLPSLRFVKETSTSGNIVMEAVLIDVTEDPFDTAKSASMGGAVIREDPTEADYDDEFSDSFESPMELSATSDVPERGLRSRTSSLREKRKHSEQQSLSRRSSEKKRRSEERAQQQQNNSAAERGSLAKEDATSVYLSATSDNEMDVKRATPKSEIEAMSERLEALEEFEKLMSQKIALGELLQPFEAQENVSLSNVETLKMDDEQFKNVPQYSPMVGLDLGVHEQQVLYENYESFGTPQSLKKEIGEIGFAQHHEALQQFGADPFSNVGEFEEQLESLKQAEANIFGGERFVGIEMAEMVLEGADTFSDVDSIPATIAMEQMQTSEGVLASDVVDAWEQSVREDVCEEQTAAGIVAARKKKAQLAEALESQQTLQGVQMLEASQIGLLDVGVKSMSAQVDENSMLKKQSIEIGKAKIEEMQCQIQTQGKSENAMFQEIQEVNVEAAQIMKTGQDSKINLLEAQQAEEQQIKKVESQKLTQMKVEEQLKTSKETEIQCAQAQFESLQMKETEITESTQAPVSGSRLSLSETGKQVDEIRSDEGMKSLEVGTKGQVASKLKTSKQTEIECEQAQITQQEAFQMKETEITENTQAPVSGSRLSQSETGKQVDDDEAMKSLEVGTKADTKINQDESKKYEAEKAKTGSETIKQKLVKKQSEEAKQVEEKKAEQPSRGEEQQAEQKQEEVVPKKPERTKKSVDEKKDKPEETKEIKSNEVGDAKKKQDDEEEKKQADAKIKAEEVKQVEAKKKADARIKAEEEKQAEVKKNEEEKKQADAKIKAEEEKQAEVKKKEEEKKQADAKIKAEEEKQAEVKKKEEEKKQADAKIKAEEEKQAGAKKEEEVKKKSEEEKKLAETKKKEEEIKKKSEEEKKLADAKKKEEEVKKKSEEEKKLADAKKAEEEKKLAETKKKNAEEEAKKKSEDEAKKKAEEEKKLAESKKKEQEEAKKKSEEEAKKKSEEETKKAEEEAKKKKSEEEAKKKSEDENKNKSEEEKKLAETKKKAEEEAKKKVEEEKKKKAEEEAKKKSEDEAKKRAEEEAKKKSEEAKKKAEEEVKKKVEEEAKKKAEEETKKKKAEEEIKKKAEETKKSEEEAKKKKVEEEKKKAEEEAKKKAEEEKQKSEEETKKKKAEEEKKKAEEESKKKKAEEEKKKSEEEAKKKKAEEEIKKKAEEEKKKSEEENKKKAEEEAKKKAEEEKKKAEEAKKKEEEAEKKKAEEEIKKKAEEEKKKSEEENKKKSEEEAKKKAEEEAKKKAEEETEKTKAEEQKKKAEEETKKKEEEAKKKKAEEEKKKAEEEAKKKSEEEKQKKTEEEKKKKAEEEKKKAEEEVKKKAEEEKKKAEEEVKKKAEEEKKKKAEEEAKKKAEEEAKKKKAEETKKSEEEATKKKVEEEKKKAEEEAKKKSEEENKKKTEEAKQKSEEETKKKAEVEAKKKSEEEKQKKSEEENKKKAEEEAKKKAEEENKKKAEEEKKKAEEEVKKKAEEEAMKKAEEEKNKGELVKKVEDPKKPEPDQKKVDGAIEDDSKKSDVKKPEESKTKEGQDEGKKPGEPGSTKRSSLDDNTFKIKTVKKVNKIELHSLKLDGDDVKVQTDPPTGKKPTTPVDKDKDAQAKQDDSATRKDSLTEAAAKRKASITEAKKVEEVKLEGKKATETKSTGSSTPDRKDSVKESAVKTPDRKDSVSAVKNDSAVKTPDRKDSVKEPAAKTPDRKDSVKEPAVKTPDRKDSVKEPATKTPDRKDSVKESAVKTPDRKDSVKETAAAKTPDRKDSVKEPAAKTPEKKDSVKEPAAKTPDRKDSVAATKTPDRKDSIAADKTPERKDSTPSGKSIERKDSTTAAKTDKDSGSVKTPERKDSVTIGKGIESKDSTPPSKTTPDKKDSKKESEKPLKKGSVKEEPITETKATATKVSVKDEPAGKEKGSPEPVVSKPPRDTKKRDSVKSPEKEQVVRKTQVTETQESSSVARHTEGTSTTRKSDKEYSTSKKAGEPTDTFVSTVSVRSSAVDKDYKSTSAVDRTTTGDNRVTSSYELGASTRGTTSHDRLQSSSYDRLATTFEHTTALDRGSSPSMTRALDALSALDTRPRTPHMQDNIETTYKYNKRSHEMQPSYRLTERAKSYDHLPGYNYGQDTFNADRGMVVCGGGPVIRPASYIPNISRTLPRDYDRSDPPQERSKLRSLEDLTLMEQTHQFSRELRQQQVKAIQRKWKTTDEDSLAELDELPSHECVSPPPAVPPRYKRRNNYQMKVSSEAEDIYARDIVEKPTFQMPSYFTTPSVGYSYFSMASLSSAGSFAALDEAHRLKRPRFSMKLSNRTTSEHVEVVKFACTVFGSPDPTIQWYKNGLPIFSDRQKYVITTNCGVATLDIHNVDSHDTGEYTCFARNFYGKAASSAILKVEGISEHRKTLLPELTHGSVSYDKCIPVNFTTGIMETNFPEVNELVLECQVKGNPKPEIMWMKNGQSIISYGQTIYGRFRADYANIFETGKCRLIIQRPRESDSGVYTCVGRNYDHSAVGRKLCWSDEITKCVNVKGGNTSPKGLGSMIMNPNFEYQAPRFITELEPFKHVHVGREIVLTVEVAGVPNPDVRWFHHKNSIYPIKQSSHVRVVNESPGIHTLYIPETDPFDFGTYTVRVTNKYGMVESSCSITEVVPGINDSPTMSGLSKRKSFDSTNLAPKFVREPRENVLLKYGDELVIQCEVEGWPQVTVNLYRGCRNVILQPRAYKELTPPVPASSADTHQNVKFTLTNLHCTDFGMYTVEAKNIVGIAKAFVNVKVLDPEGGLRTARSATPSSRRASPSSSSHYLYSGSTSNLRSLDTFLPTTRSISTRSLLHHTTYRPSSSYRKLSCSSHVLARDFY